jgi:toxin-antitoxin system PIN domain toxin
VTRFLLDVNVLAALIDPAHVQHDRAHDWFAAQGRKAWATCPLTENGVVRVVGHARYPNSAGTPAAVAELVAILRGLGGHEFWSDDISLLECQHIDTTRLLDSGQVNDTYLLALAVAHGGRLATFDRHLVTNAVVNGTKALHLLA